MRTLWLGLLLLVAGGSAAAESRFGVGLRTTSQHLAAPKDEDEDGGGNEIQLAGAGLQARWRFARSFSLELLIEGLSGQIGDGYQREAFVVTLSALWHVTPGAPWDFYLLVGTGGVSDKVIYTAASEHQVQQDLEETLVSAGAGLEYRWTHVGLGVELRAIALSRKDEHTTRPQDVVPPSSAGAQGSLTLSYYF